jgi:hypothetical protein
MFLIDLHMIGILVSQKTVNNSNGGATLGSFVKQLHALPSLRSNQGLM